jgi:ketosteroid isomerase-like protein
MIDRRNAEMGAHRDVAEVPDDLQRVLERIHAATVAMGCGDPEPYMQLWSRGGDVSLFGAWGPCKQGWDELSQTFRWVGSRFGGGELRCEDTIVGVSGDLAYTVGYERGAMVVNGSDPKHMTIRVTQIYRRESGEWRLVHRHGDFAPVDESASKLL